MRYVSTSQIEMFEACHRKWWMHSVLRLPEVKKHSTAFGTIGHSVLDRFLSADDTGRDLETGEPVVLYPPGWDTFVEKGVRYSLQPHERAVLQTLIDAAIAQGVIKRLPGRRIERNFKVPIDDDVTLVGKIDVDLPGEVQDHKFLKSLKWAKSPDPRSPDYAGAAVQMLTYAAVKMLEDPSLERVLVRYNNFCKDPDAPAIDTVHAWVLRKSAEKHLDYVRKVAGEMQEIEDRGLTAEDWQLVKGPCQKGACKAFSGCVRADVCAGYLPISEHIERTKRAMEAANSGATTTNPSLIELLREEETMKAKRPITLPNNRGTNTMTDIFARARSAQSATATATPPAAKAAPPAAAPAAQAAPPAAAPATTTTATRPAIVTDGVPPWAVQGCKACGSSAHPGFNTTGAPCRICDVNSQRAGGPVSSNYVIETDQDTGITFWVERAAAPAAEPAKPAKEKAVRVAAAVEPEEPPAETAPVTDVWAGQEAPAETAPAETAPQAAQADDDDGDDAAEETTATTKRGKKGAAGRPRKGFRLLIDCAITGGVGTVIQADKLLEDLGAKAAADAGKPSYYDLDPFRRRELWSRNVDMIAADLNRVDIVARNPNGHPDLLALVSALRTRASEVIEGLS